jgi:formylmethanofuran--tetrahydromethanopterin N-formyltransferase
MLVNNVLVEDGTIEVFPFYFTDLILTAETPEWALTAARTINHALFFNIIERLELNQEIRETDYLFNPRIGINKRLDHSDTPDYRPGVSVLIGGYDLETAKIEMRKRLYAVTCPTISIFDGFSKEDEPEDTVSVEDLIQVFSGNTMIKAKIGETIVLSSPTIEGISCRVEPSFKIKKGFIGANLLICGTSQKAALKATISAVETIQEFENVFCPYPAGINRLGSRFGSKYLYPALSEKEPETQVPKGVKCIYEIEINGISLDMIKKAIRAGIQDACNVEGIKKILTWGSAGNFEGKKILLKEILE